MLLNSFQLPHIYTLFSLQQAEHTLVTIMEGLGMYDMVFADIWYTDIL